jgi:hypothetical protein
LDTALGLEQQQVERVREQARTIVYYQPPAIPASMMDQYPFLIPDALSETYGFGSLVSMNEISSALCYRRLLWKHVIEQFTAVREVTSGNPYWLRFEVKLDFAVICRLRQRTQDLVTR